MNILPFAAIAAAACRRFFGVGRLPAEALVLLGIAVWLASRPAVRASLAAMPSAHRRVLIGLLFYQNLVLLAFLPALSPPAAPAPPPPAPHRAPAR